MTAKSCSDHAHYGRICQHSALYGMRPQVFRDGIQLSLDKRKRNRGPVANTNGILRSDCGDDAGAEHAEAVESLEVCLDAGAAAGIGAGYGECNSHE